MANLTTDSPLSRRIVRSFLHFINSVEPAPGVDTEALDIAKECLAEVFKIDHSSIAAQSNSHDSLVDIFAARNGGVSDAPPASSLGKNPQLMEGPDHTRETHFPGEDELFGQLFGALERMHYFRRMPDGSDDQAQLDRAANLFHKAVEEMQIAGCQTFDQKIMAETFKTQGNKAMQSKQYAEAIELYTFAIALSEKNAVYYCNRAAAYTHIHHYAEAVRDCLKSIEINPNYSKAYSRLGFAYYAQGKYRDAIDKGFTKVLQLDPNNESVKENIRVAEQKLREEQHREGNGQGSSSTNNFQFNHQFGGGSSFTTGSSPHNTVPFNMAEFPADIASMIMNMSGNAFSVPTFQNGGPGGPDESSPNQNQAPTFGGNININVGDFPSEIPPAFRSMMGMFSGAPPPPPSANGNQNDNSNNNNQRPDAT